MLNKQGKVIKNLHDELFIIERKIKTRIQQLQRRARSDFKRLLRRSDIRAKINFSCLFDNSYTKDWNPKIYVECKWGFYDQEEFENFCLKASETIGIEFIPLT